MTGDRARVSFDPSRKWRGLVAQQGRVTIEADWNEAATIDQERDRRVALDLVGLAGTPDDGYTVTPVQLTSSPPDELGDFTIGEGTIYVGGQRLDLDQPVTYSAQPDWLDHSTDPLWTYPVAAIPPVTSLPTTSFELVYLLASEQEVSAVEDPALADVALGGPDTMQRQRILQHFVRQPSPSATCDGSWNAFQNSLASRGLQFDTASMMIQSTTTLQVSFAQIAEEPSLCQPVATGGYLGAENQMIRVMVTGSDASGEPYLAWGFDDASFLYRITAAPYDASAQTTTLTLASAPPDSFHFPVAGQAVEVLRDAVQLTANDYIASPAGLVATVTTPYDNTQKTLTVVGQLPGDYTSAAETPQLYLRVWQGVTAATALPATPSGPATYTVELGSTGIVVTLSSGTGVFHPGDFWRFALRPIQPTVVYPARILKTPQPPDGPRTWACPLAVLTWEADNPTALSCVRPFASLVELTAGQGGCCTVNIGPSDVADGAALPALLESFANAGPVTVCLLPGTYTLSTPLAFGPELDGLTLQGCEKGVVLRAASQPGGAFGLGLIAMQAVRGVTIRRIEVAVPLVAFQPPSNSFSPANQALMQTFSNGLEVAIGIGAQDCPGLTVEDCSFDFPDAGQANVFGAGIFATGSMNGIAITGCTFKSAAPPAFVPFNELAVTQFSGSQVPVSPPYQLTFGYLQLPTSSTVSQQSTPQQLHDARITQNLFQGVTVAALVMAQMGTLCVDTNTVRSSYGGFWFISLANAAQMLIFDQLSVGDPQLYQEFAEVGLATLRDAIFVIAAQIGPLLLSSIGSLATPSLVAVPTELHLAIARETLSAIHTQAQGTTGAVTGLPSGIDGALRNVVLPVIVAEPAVAVPVADTGTSVTLRLDLHDCEIDAIVASSYSSAGLVVVDLTTDWGSAVLHGNRVRSRFPMGETALLSGLGEAAVTGNIVANEVVAQMPFGTPSDLLTSHSMVLNHGAAGTQLAAVLDPSAAPYSFAVAITGNVFIDDVSLPARSGLGVSGVQTPPLNDWRFLNTVIDYGRIAPPAVSTVNPKGGPASGNTPVTVTGSGFTGATAVTFGATPGGKFTVSTDGTQLFTTSPAGAGTVDVTVTTPTGTSGANPADQFTYLGVTGVNPASGLAAGGYTVQVTGSGFTGATAVHFGSNLGSGVIVTPDGTSLTVQVPAGSGSVDVTVTTPLGTSPTVAADKFTYKSTKEGKDTKDGKDKEIAEKLLKEHDVIINKTTDVLRETPLVEHETGTGIAAGGAAVGRAFIAPEERPAVGTGALSDGTDSP